MPGREELPTAPQEADWSGTGYKRRHRVEQFLPSLHLYPATADDNKLGEKGVRRRGDEPMLLYRSEASGCSDGETAGRTRGAWEKGTPFLPVLQRHCIQQGHSREVPTVGSTALRLFL